MENDVYLVETVLLNDLTKFLPLNNLGLKYDSAILKLDIEGNIRLFLDNFVRNFLDYNVS